MTSLIQPLNFVRTTLRAPVGTGDTQLQLAIGTGVLFNAVTTGNYVYVTVNDATTVEVMKYTSTGIVVNDTIIVTRAQDGTTAKFFPTGSCVAIGWNVEQVTDLITQTVTPLIGINTIIVNTAPVGTPPDNVVYAVNPTTGQIWFFNPGTSSWVYLNSNSVQLSSAVPTTPPPANIVWTINTITFALYYWTGVAWIAVGGSGGGGASSFLQVFSRQFLAGTPQLLGVGSDYSIADLLGLGMPFPAQCLYKSNAAITDKITLNGAGQYVFPANCIVRVDASFSGVRASQAVDCHVSLNVFHSGDTYLWQTQVDLVADSEGTQVSGIISTQPFQVLAGDTFAMTITVYNGGGTYSALLLQKLCFSASVIALL